MSYLKLLNYLFIPALFFMSAGLVVGITSTAQTWSPVAQGLLIGGVILFIIWLGYLLFSNQGFWGKRSTQVGTNALIATFSVLVILGLINFLAVRYSWRIDLSENQLFTLSPQSQAIVQNLTEPVRVWLFDNNPNSLDKELLESYRRYNPKFEFEFVNPEENPGIVKSFNAKSVGDVYLEYKDKKQLIQTLINFGQRERLSEIKLTNGIERIKRDRILNIYFLQGHGEHPLEGEKGGMGDAIASLKDKGYEVKPLNLAQTAGIPEDANVIIIAGAQRKLFKQEIEALQKYSEQGGNLFILIDPTIDIGLEPIWKEWGIELDERIIIDGSGAGNLIGLGPATPLITTYGEHPITKDFNQGISLYPLARAIGTVKVEGVTGVSLLVTSDKMWAESDLSSEEVSFDETKDVPGPLDLGVALTRTLSETKDKENTTPSPSPSPETTPSETPTPPRADETEEKPVVTPTPNPSPTPNSSNQEKSIESKMVVIGNSTFATNGLFDQQLNGDVFINSVQWLASEDQEPLSIRPKETQNRRITLSLIQAGAIFWLSIVIFPLVGFLLAAVTWWRRR